MNWLSYHLLIRLVLTGSSLPKLFKVVFYRFPVFSSAEKLSAAISHCYQYVSHSNLSIPSNLLLFAQTIDDQMSETAYYSKYKFVLS